MTPSTFVALIIAFVVVTLAVYAIHRLLKAKPSVKP
jgi:hypothetical protein